MRRRSFAPLRAGLPGVYEPKHPTVINIKGESYRLKEKRQAGLFQTQTAASTQKTSTQKQKP